MENRKSPDLFNQMSVSRAVIKNVVPAMATMLMAFLYGLADTFFIGQTHDALQIAAVSLAGPVFIVFMAVGSIFGTGATSVISRALGRKDKTYARKVSAFCLWGCLIIGCVILVVLWINMDRILTLIGASDDTWELVRSYLRIVIFGGPFILIGNCCAHILRAEGQVNKAMKGMLIGNTINFILDPILILGLHWNIIGAAIATVIGNVIGAAYFIGYFLRGESLLSIHIKDFTLGDGVCRSVFAIGVPVSLGTIMMGVSQVLANSQMATYGDIPLAGMGIASQVTMIPAIFAIGLGQGVQPLLGYCAGARMWTRHVKIMKFSLWFAFLLGVLMTGVCYLFVEQLIKLFLEDPVALEYGVQFAEIMMTASAIFGVYYVFINALEAMGAAASCLIINLCRQGALYIPALFIFHSLFDENGLVLAQPVTDLLTTGLAIGLYAIVWQRLTKGR